MQPRTTETVERPDSTPSLLTVALLAFVRALGSPLGVTALDAVAAMTFIVFVVTLSVQNLFERSEPVAV